MRAYNYAVKEDERYDKYEMNYGVFFADKDRTFRAYIYAVNII